jgi:drug/metabolite transporter (DMT)-like permease
MNLIEHIGLGELLAIASAFTLAGAQIYSRLGMLSTSPLMAALIVNTFVSLGGLIASLYRGTLLSSTWQPILWYAVVGVLGPGIGRIALLIGINRMGLGRSVTISSSTPLWSTLIAVIFLGERPTFWVVIGTFAIVFGVALLSTQDDRSQDFRSWLQGALIYPLVSSIAYGLPPIFAKLAYAHQATPAVGMAVAFFMANVVLITFRSLVPVMGTYQIDRQAMLKLSVAGILNLLTSFCLWTAVLITSVSTAMPLSRTTPILVVLFSWLFLGKHEIITRRVLISAVFVVVGGVLISALG